MERHFKLELDELKQQLLWMGGLAERSVRQAMRAVLECDEKAAQDVFSNEDAINKLQIEIDERVVQLLALYQLMAVDLRFSLAAARINNDLERIGDQAINIAKSAQHIIQYPRVKPYVDLPRMSDLAEEMVRDSLNAVGRGDVELARSVLVRDDRIDLLRDEIFRGLLAYMTSDPSLVRPTFGLLLVAKNLERAGDQATNIAEDVIFMVAGRDVRHGALDRR